MNSINNIIQAGVHGLKEGVKEEKDKLTRNKGEALNEFPPRQKTDAAGTTIYGDHMSVYPARHTNPGKEKGNVKEN